MGYMDKEQRNAWNREYYRKNRAKMLAKNQAYRNKPGRKAALAARQRKYYQENVNHYRDYVREKNQARRVRVLTHYSNGTPKCACCGESIIDFLTIDHMRMDGAKHRREIAKGSTERAAGQKTYMWLEKNKYPAGFQVLCYNCNCGSFKHKGVCPHKL